MQGGGMVSGSYGGGRVSSGSGRGSASLGDILERVLDKGIVIAGDIKVNLLDIELLTIKLRLLIVSVETAKELGIDWWERDPWLNSGQDRLEAENRRLRERIAALEKGGEQGGAIEGRGERSDAIEGRGQRDDAIEGRPVNERRESGRG
jgi:hypothetical protein